MTRPYAMTDREWAAFLEETVAGVLAAGDRLADAVESHVSVCPYAEGLAGALDGWRLFRSWVDTERPPTAQPAPRSYVNPWDR